MILENIFGDTLPYIMSNNYQGRIFWATIFTVRLFFSNFSKLVILLPMGFMTKFQELRIFSMLGVLASFFVVIAIVTTFFSNEIVVPSPAQRLEEAEYFKFT